MLHGIMSPEMAMFWSQKQEQQTSHLADLSLQLDSTRISSLFELFFILQTFVVKWPA